jgi:hypothetical protein
MVFTNASFNESLPSVRLAKRKERPMAAHHAGAFGLDIGAEAYDDVDDLVEVAEPMPDHTSVVQTPQHCEIICATKS